MYNVLPLALRVKRKVNPGKDFSIDKRCQWQYILCMKKPQLKRKHDRPLQIRVAQELYELFESAANASGLSLSAWVRDRLTQTARRELRQAGMVAGELKPR